MKKTVFPILFIILFSAISYAIMPSDALSWGMSVKDGTWTVKGLGLAGGKEGQEAISWVMDPSGKIVSQSANAISDTCGGCLYIGQILVDPVTGAQGEVLKKLGEEGSGWAPVVNEVVSIQSFLSKNDMKDGTLDLVHNKDGSYHIKEMSPVNIAGEAPDSFRKALGTNPKNVEAKVIYDKDKDKSTVILKPLPPVFGAESPAEHISVTPAESGGKDSDKQKKYETDIGDFRSGSYIELQEVEGLEMVSKARIVSEEGQKYKVNGNEVQASRDVAISVDSLLCKEGSCTTSMTIDSKISRYSTKPGEDVVDVKEPVKISLCDNDLNVLSGSKLSVDIKNDGKKQSCVLKNADLKWSNSKEEFGDRQVLSFGNVYAHIDPQKWEHQEGYLKFDEKTNILEGTIRKADFNDGTWLVVDGDTKRMAMGSTDSMKVKVDSKGNFLSSSMDIKDRKISLYNNKEKIIDNLEIKDPSSQPFTIERDEKSQRYTISTPSWTYYKKLPDSKEAKSNLVISESNNPDISPDLKNLVYSMIGAPLTFQVPDGDFMIPINPPDTPELFGKYKPSESSQDPSQKYVLKKGDSYWRVALDHELSLRNFNEEDKKDIIDASKKGTKEFLGVLKSKYSQYDSSTQDFFISRLNKDILEDSKNLEKEYSNPSKLKIGQSIDLSVINKQSTTVISKKGNLNTPVVVHSKGQTPKPALSPNKAMKKTLPKPPLVETLQA